MTCRFHFYSATTKFTCRYVSGQANKMNKQAHGLRRATHMCKCTLHAYMNGRTNQEGASEHTEERRTEQKTVRRPTAPPTDRPTDRPNERTNERTNESRIEQSTLCAVSWVVLHRMVSSCIALHHMTPHGIALHIALCCCWVYRIVLDCYIVMC